MEDWFQDLFGFEETSPEVVHQNLDLSEGKLYSKVNQKSHGVGVLTTPSLGELRNQAQELSTELAGKLQVSIERGDVGQMHCIPENKDALFQVASQFNLLEMVSQDISPETGVTGYQDDHTQGPICAMAAGAGTVYRNYFTSLAGVEGQTSTQQVDCLKDIGIELGNQQSSLWYMKNGYALCSSGGLERVNGIIAESDSARLDEIRNKLRIGLHSRVQVTNAAAPSNQFVSQAYCSALPVSYSDPPSHMFGRFAGLILEGAYEATICAGIVNAVKNGSNKILLTQLGGGVFGNRPQWIHSAMSRAFNLFSDLDLDVRIVSYSGPSDDLIDLVEEY